MRDLLVVLVFSGAAIMALRQPYIGVLLWTWIGIMNPHRLAWGFAYSLPLGAIAAGVTLLAMTHSKPRPKFPVNTTTVLLLMFIAWTGLTTIFAIHVEPSIDLFIRAFKTFFMTLVALAVIQERKHVMALLWVVVGSLCFFGIKGGIFTIATGGSYRVWGPPDSLIFGNNELAVALIMCVPLLYYLSLQMHKAWQRWAFYFSMIFCSAAAIGSQSRGAFLAIIAMVGALSLKSKYKLKITLVLIALSPILLASMPDTWWERMESIRNYNEDTSAMGRIIAWKLAWNIAMDRITGAGFATSTRFIYDLYSPSLIAKFWLPTAFISRSLVITALSACSFTWRLWFATYRQAGSLYKLTEGRADLGWISELGRMIQVSLVGFFVGGAFLSLAYWDVPLYFLVIVVALEQLAKRPPEQVASSPATDMDIEQSRQRTTAQLRRHQRA